MAFLDEGRESRTERHAAFPASYARKRADGRAMYYFLYLCFMWGVFVISRLFVQATDQDAGISWRFREAAAAGIYLAAAAIVCCGQRDMAKGILLGFLFAYLAFGGYCDHQTKTVYRFLQYPAFMAGGFYLLLAGTGMEGLMGLACYGLLQLALLRRFYGWADTLAFLACGFYLGGGRAAGGAAPGGTVLYGTVHVGLSLLIMTFWQACRGNMDWRRGKLKEPSPFLPSIALAALGLLAAGLLV